MLAGMSTATDTTRAAAVYVVAALLIAMIAGCGAAPTTTPPKLSGQQEYQSVYELAHDLTIRGHRCDVTDRATAAPSGADPGIYRYVREFGMCQLGGSGGPTIVFYVYTSQSQVNAFLGWIIPRFQGKFPVAWLVGNKWTITCGAAALCNELAADVGGSVIPLNQEAPK